MRNSFKKTTDILLSALVLFAAMSLGWLGLKGTSSISVSAPISTDYPSIPENAAVIVVDAGHGGFDGGAVGAYSGTIEAELNLLTAEALSEALTAKGFYVIMTRSDNNSLGETKQEDMQERKRIMLLPYVDAVISIHMNKFTDPTVYGPMVFYYKGSSESEMLASSVMKRICENTGRPERFANPEDLFVLRVPKVPSVLVECGFLSNKDDEFLLQSTEYRSKIVNGIVEGITGYFTQNTGKA